MNRRRILYLAIFTGVNCLAIAFLTAANEVKDKEAVLKQNAPVVAPNPAATPTGVGAKKLVCLGYADTEDAIIRKILPDNFPMPSRVTKVLAKEGDEVKEGQPLLEFDLKLYDLKLKEASKGVVIAMKEKEKAEMGIQVHDAKLNSGQFTLSAKQKELKNKEVELEEAKRIFNINKTEYTLNAAQAAFAAAKDNLEAAKWDLQSAKAMLPSVLVDIADATISRYRVLEEQAQLAKDQVVCKAPCDGKIIRSFAWEGMIFGQHTREPAFLLIKKGPLIVRAEVPQEFAHRVLEKQIARIEDESDPSKFWKGRVIKIGENFLPKRSSGLGSVEIVQQFEDRVLECIVSIELTGSEKPPRYGQKLRIQLGE